MVITATEFKTNLGKYFSLIEQEDIFITKNGKVVAQFIQPRMDKKKILESLVGIAKPKEDLSLDDIRMMRLSRQ